MSAASSKLDDLTLNAYQHVIESREWDGEWLSAATGAPIERLDEVHRTLSDLRLIERDADPGGGWRAVSPRVAMAKLVAPIETEVRRRAAYAENLRERLQMLLPIHEANRRSAAPDAVEIVPDEADLVALVDDEARRCRAELMVMQARAEPSTPTAARHRGARDRGVRVRTVFRHAARSHPPTEEFMDALGGAGTPVRTVGEPPISVIIFDREVCVLLPDGSPAAPRARSADGSPGVAVAVRQPLVVSMMAAVFERVWAGGSDYSHREHQPAWIDDELRRSILVLLATGAKDDLVARRLGISIRTCRRRIADIMKDLDANSRFQAGIAAGRRGLL